MDKNHRRQDSRHTSALVDSKQLANKKVTFNKLSSQDINSNMSNKRYDSAELIGSDKKSSVKQVQMNSKINRDSGRKPVTLDSKKLDY